VSILGRIFRGQRHRSAARLVALDPSAENYLALARESVVSGEHNRVEAICHEALDLHPGHSELVQMARRAARMRLDARVRDLEADLLVGARPALWSELFDAHMEAGRFSRASDVARRWGKAGGGGEALHLESCGALGAFFGGGVREDGQLAWDLGQRAAEAMPRDPRPLESLVALTGRVGAHAERRTLLARLLELCPGKPELEAAFRESSQQSDSAPGFVQALADSTRRGALDQEPRGVQSVEQTKPTRGRSVRGLLKNIARREGVHCATYQQGGTALVQGLSGPVADRTARAIRESVRKTRELTTRVGLGPMTSLTVEGAHGTLVMSSGTLGLGAAWCEGDPPEELVRDLGRLAEQTGGKV
jgi:hypothetical protein